MRKIRMNNKVSTSDSESSIDWNDDDLRNSRLQTGPRVSISKYGPHESSRKFFQKLRKLTSTSDSESYSDWEDEADDISHPETDSRYSSQESVELSNLSDSRSTLSEFFEDLNPTLSYKGQSHEEYSSSTSDTYNSSDDEINSIETFFDSSSCSIQDDTDLDQCSPRQSINCTCTSPNANSSISLQKSTGQTVSSARSTEQESEDRDNLFESHGKSNYFHQDNFTNIAGTDSTTATTCNRNAKLKTITKADSVNDPANFFPEEQCWMRMDILLRLKDMLHEIVNDNKEYEAEVCTDIEQRMTEIIKDNENLLKEQVPPEVLEKIEDRITHSKLDELDTAASTRRGIPRLPALAHLNYNNDDEQDSNSDSSDSSDDEPMDSSEEFKKYFDKYQTLIAQVKLSGRIKLRSWRDDISSQLRKNWIQSIVYTAETQVELKPGKKIDQDGLKRFGECLEWEVFHRRATNAVEYSNILCDIHSDIGHGRMTAPEREYLMFLAYKS